MTNFYEYMTNNNLSLQAIIRYDDDREIRAFNVRDKRCCVFIQDVYKMPDFSNKTAETLGTSGTAISAVNQEEYNNLDTNRYNKDTEKLDFSTTNFSKEQIEKQNQDLVLHAKEFLTAEDDNPVPFEPETIRLISLWASNNPKIIKKTIGIILNARRDVQELHQDQHLFFILDNEPDLQTKITQTLRRYFNALRSDDKQIKNYENYLYITMKNMFENYGSSKLQREHQLEHSTKTDSEEQFINGLRDGLPESIRNATNANSR